MVISMVSKYFKMNSNLMRGLGIGVFSLVVWFFIMPWQIGGEEEMVYPRFVVIWIGISGLLLVAKGWRERAELTSDDTQNGKVLIQVGIVIILLISYVLLIQCLGFLASSFLFYVTTTLFLGARNWRTVLLAPGMMLLCVYILLEKILNCPLPKGYLL
ncbi:MAG TPA: tripartite tricarboxylate transporter TctB family protein [Desulfobacterales bacterium]|nr:tripartite tricarboxylate transporter TctB family protein [Desulfobacterales bacterium]